MGDLTNPSITSARMAKKKTSKPEVMTPAEIVANVKRMKTSSKVYQLALWPEEQRAMPLNFVRSALFSATKSKKGEPALTEVTLASANNVSIVFSGKRLTQVHADVWEQLIHRARSQEIGTRIVVREREFLRSIGRNPRQREKALLSQWWAELQATAVRVIDHKNNDRSLSVSLLPSEARQTLPSGEVEYSIKIDEEMNRIFRRKESLAFIDWEKRKLLKQKPLALWLQHFFAGVSRPLSVDMIRSLSGSDTRRNKHFRSSLRTALKALVDVGVLQTAAILKDDAVMVTRVALTPLKGPAPIQRQPELLGMPAPVISEATKQRYSELYRVDEFAHCLSDWLRWQGSRTADDPDRAFLGFAKKWASERQTVVLAQSPQAVF